MIHRFEKRVLGVALALVPMTLMARPVEPQEPVIQEEAVDVEVRTLKQGSAIRSVLESRLGKGRVAQDFRFEVTSDPADNDGRSLIDMFEASAMTKDFDPYLDPIDPNGPGSYPGQTQSTHVNCTGVKLGSSTQPGNITWNWAYTPDKDTNGDGRTNSKDNCPCSWVLLDFNVQFATDQGALDC